MGSAAKGTTVRPIDDIDVLAVFSNANGAWDSYRFDSQALLYRVRRAYSGLSTAQVGARGQAVRIFFKNGAMSMWRQCSLMATTSTDYRVATADGLIPLPRQRMLGSQRSIP